MKENDMETVVNLIDRVLTNTDNEKEIASVKEEVSILMGSFPLYPGLK
jgi:glycine hydroxymethyltransferase